MAEIKQKISRSNDESISVEITGSAASDRKKGSNEQQCQRLSEEEISETVVTKKPPVPIKRKKNVSVSDKSVIGVDSSQESIRTTVAMNKRLKVEDKVVTAKPPLPPRPEKLNQVKIAPKSDKVKRIAEENKATLVHKLNAYAEQLRLEVTDLKSALITERNAVRALRAQIEANTRRAKVETKKHQEALLRKISIPATSGKKSTTASVLKKDDTPSTTTVGVECSLLLDTGKLNQEISILRDANKCLEEKFQVKDVH
ncbi:hypothetical protein DMENIID0001_072920 [Sergentomyia squamirostris]